MAWANGNREVILGEAEPLLDLAAAVGAKVGICQVANLNAPGQVILSGEHAALDAPDRDAAEDAVRDVAERRREVEVDGNADSIHFARAQSGGTKRRPAV